MSGNQLCEADQHAYQNTREGRPKAPHSQDSCKRPHGQTVDKVAQTTAKEQQKKRRVRASDRDL